MYLREGQHATKFRLVSGKFFSLFPGSWDKDLAPLVLARTISGRYYRSHPLPPSLVERQLYVDRSP